MLKKLFLLLLITLLSKMAGAQSADTAVYNRYLDFNMARLDNDISNAIEIGENLLPDAGKLPAKSRLSFYNGLAKMYEDNGQVDKAIPYYEKVATALPDYYVVHRALGYLYLKPAVELSKKLNASSGDKVTYDKLKTAYRSAVRKILPHLEKAQACDPSDETLEIIKQLYKNIDDRSGLQTLNSRLFELSKNCITVLSDQ